MLRRRSHKGFSLLEVLVATVILAVILLVLFTAVQQTSDIWASTTGRIEKFQKARESFDLISKRLSQSTLNTYWDYDVPLGAPGAARAPERYERRSELRFISGPAASLVGGSAAQHPGHAIFFQAPGGIASDGSGALQDALNTWGYFIEYGSDAPYRPPFLNSVIPAKNRFRLIELLEPSDELSIYRYTSGADPVSGALNFNYNGVEWFTDAIALGAPARKRVLADNVVLLLIAPRLSYSDDPAGTGLASDFSYDSTDSRADPKFNPRHQLPPLLEITLVAIDERSAQKIEWGATPPDFGIAGLFDTAAAKKAHLEDFEEELRDLGLDYRTFTTVVDIPASRWSTEQEN
jgi:uncharacterized protein (TIGR02599 family)